MNCDVHIRKGFYANVVLSGGATTTPRRHECDVYIREELYANVVLSRWVVEGEGKFCRPPLSSPSVPARRLSVR